MPYLVFSAMQYEEQGGMADLVYFAKTEEELLGWARANLPMPSHYWADAVEVTEDGCFRVDEHELLKGKATRNAERL